MFNYDYLSASPLIVRQADSRLLPSPMLQAPDLVKPKPEELTNNFSCAEMAVLNVQSESVNIRVAAEAADYLYRMAAGNLKRFATYFDDDGLFVRIVGKLLFYF